CSVQVADRRQIASPDQLTRTAKKVVSAITRHRVYHLWQAKVREYVDDDFSGLPRQGRIAQRRVRQIGRLATRLIHLATSSRSTHGISTASPLPTQAGRTERSRHHQHHPHRVLRRIIVDVIGIFHCDPTTKGRKRISKPLNTFRQPEHVQCNTNAALLGRLVWIIRWKDSGKVGVKAWGLFRIESAKVDLISVVDPSTYLQIDLTSIGTERIRHQLTLIRPEQGLCVSDVVWRGDGILKAQISPTIFGKTGDVHSALFRYRQKRHKPSDGGNLEVQVVCAHHLLVHDRVSQPGYAKPHEKAAARMSVAVVWITSVESRKSAQEAAEIVVIIIATTE